MFPLPFPILLILVISLFTFDSLDKGLSILLIFSKNQVLFCWVSLFPILYFIYFNSTIIILFLLLVLRLACLLFSSFLRWKVKLLTWYIFFIFFIVLYCCGGWGYIVAYCALLSSHPLSSGILCICFVHFKVLSISPWFLLCLIVYLRVCHFIYIYFWVFQMSLLLPSNFIPLLLENRQFYFSLFKFIKTIFMT
jgi:hypothetical protein